MKLQPKKVASTAQSPYEGDLLRRSQFGERLYTIVSGIEDHGVICLDSPWGEGKSTFVHMWSNYLKSKGTSAITFNAFDSDWYDDVMASFVSEIQEQTAKIFPHEDAMTNAIADFAEKSGRIGKILLKSAIGVGVRLLTSGIIDASKIDLDKNILLEGSGKSIDGILDQEIDSYVAKKRAIDEFRNSLAELALLVRERQNFPLLIIIDELDRTKPRHALQLLEITKHLFDIDNVVFLLVTNLDQLRKSVNSEYGALVDSNLYLQKFIGLTISLPLKSDTGAMSDYVKYFRSLVTDLNAKIDYEVQELASEMMSHFSLSLREIEKVALNLAIYFELRHKSAQIPLVVILIAIVRYRDPETYQRIEKGTVTFQELSEKFDLAGLYKKSQHSYFGNYLDNALKYHFLSDEEVELDPKKEEIVAFGRGFNFGSRLMTPIRYCRDLNIVL